MTRKDYIRIANALASVRPSFASLADARALRPIQGPRESLASARARWNHWNLTCSAVANALAIDNARFDADRFMLACGAERAS